MLSIETLEIRNLLSGYTIMDLTATSGSNFFAADLNDQGMVAGRCGDKELPCLFDGHGFRMLALPLTLAGGSPLSINNDGNMAGVGRGTDSTSHAIFWDQEGAVDLGNIPGQDISVGYINDANTIVGVYVTGVRHPDFTAVIWHPYRDPELIPHLAPTSINDAGQISGEYRVAPDQFQPVIYENGTPDALPDAGFGGATVKINSQGDVAGLVNDGSGQSQAVVWLQGKLTEIGVAGYASAVNDADQVVGAGMLQRDFLWQGDQPQDLNDLAPLPGWTFEGGGSINNAGQILVSGRNDQKNISHSFLLTPDASGMPSWLGWALRQVQKHQEAQWGPDTST